MKIKKYRIFALLLALVLLSYMQTPAMAESDAPEDGEAIEAAFTDAVFLKKVREVVGKTNGEHIYRSDVENITELNVKGSYGKERIESLQGIEYFTALQELNCGYNKITELDLSHNPNLRELYCYVNDLTELNLSHNPKLEVLDCSFTCLESLNISNCPELNILDCNNTELKTLDVRNCVNLTELICGCTYLTALDVSNNKLLEDLEVYDACLVSLDVSNNTKLILLDCEGNQLKSIDVSKNSELIYLYCSGNKLKRLDLTNNPALEVLLCCNNYMGDAPELSILGLSALLPKLGEPISKEDYSWSAHTAFVYYPQKTAEEEPEPPTPPTPPVPVPVPIPVPEPTDAPDDGNPFADVSESEWFYDDIMAAYKDGLMFGISDNEFAPQGEMTRGMFVSVLYRMEGEPQTELDYLFVDVPENEYFANAVAWASKNGIVEGYLNERFAPYRAINREEMAAVIYRFAKYRGLDITADKETTYADNESILDFAVDAVKWITANGIMQGGEENAFHPQADTKRAEAAAIFNKVYGLIR